MQEVFQLLDRFRCKRRSDVIGRWDPAFKTSKPLALNFLITLRTVWSSQPKVRAIRLAVSLRALASTI